MVEISRFVAYFNKFWNSSHRKSGLSDLPPRRISKEIRVGNSQKIVGHNYSDHVISPVKCDRFIPTTKRSPHALQILIFHRSVTWGINVASPAKAIAASPQTPPAGGVSKHRSRFRKARSLRKALNNASPTTSLAKSRMSRQANPFPMRYRHGTELNSSGSSESVSSVSTATDHWMPGHLDGSNRFGFFWIYDASKFFDSAIFSTINVFNQMACRFQIEFVA